LFDEFITSYKFTNSPASEVIEAFNQFLLALNKFFDIYEELTEDYLSNKEVFIIWYKSAIIFSDDTICANFNCYQQAIFNNISINMNHDKIKDYTTHDGMCFDKVILMTISIAVDDTS